MPCTFQLLPSELMTSDGTPEKKVAGLRAPEVTQDGTRFFRATSFELFAVSAITCKDQLHKQSISGARV